MPSKTINPDFTPTPPSSALDAIIGNFLQHAKQAKDTTVRFTLPRLRHELQEYLEAAACTEVWAAQSLKILYASSNGHLATVYKRKTS